MQLKTVLNRVHKVNGFVYGKAEFAGERIEVEVHPRKGSGPICSGCGERGPGYDVLERRAWEFVPLWAISVVLLYAMRRVDCKRCGVKVEQVPWGDGKRHVTRAYAVFLSQWARRLSWKEVSEIFQTSWQTVYRSVAWVVAYGLKHRSLEGVTAIGVDEVQFRKGHDYLTVVYQINAGCRRLLWVGGVTERFKITHLEARQNQPDFYRSLYCATTLCSTAMLMPSSFHSNRRPACGKLRTPARRIGQPLGSDPSADAGDRTVVRPGLAVRPFLHDRGSTKR